MTTLRPYQTKAIEELRAGISSGYKRQILALATGAGKTRTAGEVVKMAADKGKHVAFVCNRIELVLQASAAFHKLGIDHGIVQGQNSIHWHKPVLVCSIQTLIRRKMPAIDVMIVDEAHACAGSRAYQKILSMHNNIPVIGLTATPYTKGLGREYPWGKLFERVVVGATIPDLIGQGYLVDVEIYAPSEPDLAGVSVVAGDYQKDQLADACNKAVLVGDIVKTYQKLAMGKLAVCFATNVAHSQHIVKEFNEAGIKAVHVDGYMTDEERRPIIDAFKRGEFQVLSNCHLLAEGFDAPETEVVILARPTKSLVRYIQMVGRALRPANGKKHALLLDHSGVVKRLGWPTDEQDMTLCDGKPKESKPREKLPKVCPSCYAVRPHGMKACPVCKFEPAPTPKDVEAEDGELTKLEKKKAKSFSMDQKQAIYSALLGWCEQKGFKYGAAWHKFKEIVGVHPANGLEKVVGPMVPEVDSWLVHERIKWANSKNKKQHKARNPDECPKCGDVNNFTPLPGKGPHAGGAKCKHCSSVWWFPRKAA